MQGELHSSGDEHNQGAQGGDERRWAQLKTQKDELMQKEVKVQKMQQVMTQQSKQLYDMEVRRQKELELIKSDPQMTGACTDDMKQAMSTLQMNLRARDERITSLTEQLRLSAEANKTLEKDMQDISSQVKQVCKHYKRMQNVIHDCLS